MGGGVVGQSITRSAKTALPLGDDVGIVYHYTDTQAFKGDAEKAALWATDFRYLNDSRELVYTWIAFVEKLEQLVAQSSEYSEAYRAQLKALRLMNATDLMHFDDAMFVACFTELPDAVSQWTRYGANGHGLALLPAHSLRATPKYAYELRKSGQRESTTPAQQRPGSAGSPSACSLTILFSNQRRGDDRVQGCATSPNQFARSHLIGPFVVKTTTALSRRSHWSGGNSRNADLKMRCASAEALAAAVSSPISLSADASTSKVAARVVTY